MSSLGKAFSSEKLLSWAPSEFAILLNVFYPIFEFFPFNQYKFLIVGFLFRC